jgi:hypothetical protein
VVVNRSEPGPGDPVFLTRGASTTVALVLRAAGPLLDLIGLEWGPNAAAKPLLFKNIQPLTTDNDGKPPMGPRRWVVNGEERIGKQPLYWTPCLIAGAAIGIPGDSPIPTSEAQVPPLPNEGAYHQPGPPGKRSDPRPRWVQGGGGHGDGSPEGVDGLP